MLRSALRPAAGVVAGLKRLSPMLKKADDKFDSISMFTTGAKLLGMGLGMLYLSHVVGCLWYYVGKKDETLLDGTLRQGWVSATYYRCVCTSIHQCWHCKSEHDCAPLDTPIQHTSSHKAPRLIYVDFGSRLTQCRHVDRGEVSELLGSGWDPKLTIGVWRLWLRSYYWSITTLTTVGFGDISATTELEMALSIVRLPTHCTYSDRATAPPQQT